MLTHGGRLIQMIYIQYISISLSTAISVSEQTQRRQNTHRINGLCAHHLIHYHRRLREALSSVIHCIWERCKYDVAFLVQQQFPLQFALTQFLAAALIVLCRLLNMFCGDQPLFHYQILCRRLGVFTEQNLSGNCHSGRHRSPTGN